MSWVGARLRPGGGHGAREGLIGGSLNGTVPGSAVGCGQVSEHDTDLPVRVRTRYTDRVD